MKIFKTFTVLFIVLLCMSCDRKSCETDNPIFLQYTFNDKAYKAELAKQIESIGQENLRYWLHDYINQDHNEYLLFYVQNNDLCAEILVKMNHWNRLELIQKTKGKGSFNAEFRGLRFDISRNSNNEVEFIYNTNERIID